MTNMLWAELSCEAGPVVTSDLPPALAGRILAERSWTINDRDPREPKKIRNFKQRHC